MRMTLIAYPTSSCGDARCCSRSLLDYSCCRVRMRYHEDPWRRRSMRKVVCRMSRNTCARRPKSWTDRRPPRATSAGTLAIGFSLRSSTKLARNRGVGTVRQPSLKPVRILKTGKVRVTLEKTRIVKFRGNGPLRVLSLWFLKECTRRRLASRYLVRYSLVMCTRIRLGVQEPQGVQTTVRDCLGAFCEEHARTGIWKSNCLSTAKTLSTSCTAST